jgi:hypothetical protein
MTMIPLVRAQYQHEHLDRQLLIISDFVVQLFMLRMCAVYAYDLRACSMHASMCIARYYF